MALGGVEEIVRERHHFAAVEAFFLLAFFDEHRNINLLGAASLVRWNSVLIAKNIFYGIAQRIVATAAAIGFIATQHRRLHILRYRAGAAVGEQINKHVFAVEQEGVHPGLNNGVFAVFAGGTFYWLNDANTERFWQMFKVIHGVILKSLFLARGSPLVIHEI